MLKKICIIVLFNLLCMNIVLANDNEVYDGYVSVKVGSIWYAEDTDAVYSTSNTDIADIFFSEKTNQKADLLFSGDTRRCGVKFLSPGNVVITTFVQKGYALNTSKILFHVLPNEKDKNDVKQKDSGIGNILLNKENQHYNHGGNSSNGYNQIEVPIKEYTAYVGGTWGFDNPAVKNLHYEIETPNIAQLYYKDGVQKIRFTALGRAIVRASYRYYGEDFHYKYIFNVKDMYGSSNSAGNNKSEYSSAYSEDYAQEVLDLVNAERAKVGAKPLRLNRELCQAADIRAAELVQKFSHTRPNGTDFDTVLSRKYENRGKGENAAAGSATPQAVVDQWMHSPGHKANILCADYTELGVGRYKDDNSEYIYYWIQIFLM